MLRLYGVPYVFINIFRDLYLRSSCCINNASSHTDFFEIIGVRQGCILFPLLFLVALDYVRQRAGARIGEGIHWSDEDRLGNLDFADDIALLEENRTKWQTAMTDLNEEAKSASG